MSHPFRVREIAVQAGLSEATVDRVLNGRNGVRPSTAQQVERAIADLERQQTQITNTLEVPEWGLPSNSNYADQQGRLLAPNGLTFDPSHTIVTGANYVLPGDEKAKTN